MNAPRSGDTSLGPTLSDLALEHADRTALVTDERSWVYGDLVSAAETLATALALRQTDAARGIGHLFGLEPEAVVTALAVSRVAGILAPANPAWTVSERDRYAQVIRPDVIVSSQGHAWAGDGWVEETLLLPGFGPVSLWTRDPDDARPAQAPTETEVALWTSGSGGAPKVACHSWASLLAGARAANERLGFGPESIWLATLAWAHVGGLAVVPRSFAAAGALAFAGSKFDASLAIEGLRAHRATHVSLVPAMAHRLIERAEPPPATLDVALVGGAAMPPAVTERAASEGWPISLTYGMTETGSQVATATTEEARGRPSGVGKALSGAELRVESHGDEPGEIFVRGPSLFLGYLGEPARDPTSWFGTGDLGFIDSDGGLRVTGRRGDRIVSGGVNVDPVEVEDLVARHPGVREVCVVGLPDAVWGEIVACTIVLEQTAEATDLDAWTRERLSGARAPRRWAFVEELPRTATGKVDRAAVIANLQSEESG